MLVPPRRPQAAIASPTESLRSSAAWIEASHLAEDTAGDLGADRLFVRSLNPMLLADDDRCCVAANDAACRLLGRPADAVRQLRIDDLTAPHLRSSLGATWPRFARRAPVEQTVPWNLQMPDGTHMRVDLCSVPHVRPGRHLAIILPPIPGVLNARGAGGESAGGRRLTEREREVLTLVALGNTGIEIADHLCLSPATVQTHVANALIKLKAKNRAHGVALALYSHELDLA